MESAPRFFSKKVPELHNTEEVTDAVEKHNRLTGEKVPNTPEAKIGVYMDRLENIFLNEDEDTRQRNVEMLRENIHDAFVIKREDVPESYFELQQRIARERGQAVETIPEGVKEQMKDVIIEDQTKSLDEWVDYLSSNDAMYPTWFKYLAFRNVTKLSQFDKELGKFKERTKSTTAPFPDIYREALAQLCDIYERAVSRDKEALKDPEFQEFVSKKFPTQYAELILKNLENSQENREEIKGQWVKYEKGDMSGAERLYESLQGKGTGWCTAGESTARYQIQQGDFYVYYSNDTDGNSTIPRLAIRMSGTNIGEVRGVLPGQEVEHQLQEVLDGKLNEFGPEADKYRKKSADMKRLTELEKTMQKGGIINREDFLFLYEVNGEIDGFGYQRDPRIQSLQSLISKEQAAEFLSLDATTVEVDHRKINEATLLYLPRVKEFLDQSKPPYNLRAVYDKMLSNQKRLNSILTKNETGIELTAEDLRIVYEIDEKFEGAADVRTEMQSFMSTRNVLKDFKIIFGPETDVAIKKEDVNEATTMLFLNRKIYQRTNKNYTKTFEDTVSYNTLLRNLTTHDEITKDDLAFIYDGPIHFFGTQDETQRAVHKIKMQVKEDKYLEKALGLQSHQLAHKMEEITEDTVLYIPEIASYLSDDTKAGEYDLKKKMLYEERLNNEKTVRRIAKKIDTGEDLTHEEIQFVFRESERFPFPYTTKYEALEEKALRERVSQKNLEAVLGNDLAQLLRDKPATLKEWAYYGGPREENTYFPCLETRDDGSFLLCASVGVEELGYLTYIDTELRKNGYKLASGTELQDFLEESDLFSATDETVVYGSGYVWKKNLWNLANEQMEQKVGHLLSLDDERLQGEEIVSSQARSHDGYPETQRALIAVTKVIDDGLKAYDDRETDDELYELQERLSKK